MVQFKQSVLVPPTSGLPAVMRKVMVYRLKRELLRLPAVNFSPINAPNWLTGTGAGVASLRSPHLVYRFIYRVPIFQFKPEENVPPTMVMRVNSYLSVLSGRHSPWGELNLDRLAWWMKLRSDLDGRAPWELLGATDEQRLLEVAQPTPDRQLFET